MFIFNIYAIHASHSKSLIYQSVNFHKKEFSTSRSIFIEQFLFVIDIFCNITFAPARYTLLPCYIPFYIATAHFFFVYGAIRRRWRCLTTTMTVRPLRFSEVVQCRKVFIHSFSRSRVSPENSRKNRFAVVIYFSFTIHFHRSQRVKSGCKNMVSGTFPSHARLFPPSGP